MQNHDITCEQAIAALDEAAPIVHGSPHWELRRGVRQYRVVVYLPETFAGLDDVIDVHLDRFASAAWIEATGATPLDALTAALAHVTRLTATAEVAA